MLGAFYSAVVFVTGTTAVLYSTVETMLTTAPTTDVLKRLQEAQRIIAELTVNLRKAEAIRDHCIRQLCDSAGAHDQRPQGVR